MYQQRIREILAEEGFVGTNPNWVEAWMRLECSTLDWLCSSRFRQEVKIAVQCIKASTQKENESLAKSMGF